MAVALELRIGESVGIFMTPQTNWTQSDEGGSAGGRSGFVALDTFCLLVHSLESKSRAFVAKFFLSSQLAPIHGLVTAPPVLFMTSDAGLIEASVQSPALCNGFFQLRVLMATETHQFLARAGMAFETLRDLVELLVRCREWPR